MFDNKISTPPTGHRLKPGAKVILLLVAGAVLFFGFRTAVGLRYNAALNLWS